MPLLVGLVIFIWLLNGCDVLLTAHILQLGGSEANPIVAHAIAHFGTEGIMYLKLPFLVGLCLVVLTEHIRPTQIALGVVAVVYSGLVIYSANLLHFI